MRKIVDGTKVSVKDENGSFVPSYLLDKPKLVLTDISIDDLLGKGLLALSRMMKLILEDITAGAPDRNTIANLKDVMTMLHELKKKEQELLDNLSDSELEEISKK